MYIYCKETGTPAFNGSYGQQPQVWKEFYFIINNAMKIGRNIIKNQEIEREKQLKENRK